MTNAEDYVMNSAEKLAMLQEFYRDPSKAWMRVRFGPFVTRPLKAGESQTFTANRVISDIPHVTVHVGEYRMSYLSGSRKVTVRPKETITLTAPNSDFLKLE